MHLQRRRPAYILTASAVILTFSAGAAITQSGQTQSQASPSPPSAVAHYKVTMLMPHVTPCSAFAINNHDAVLASIYDKNADLWNRFGILAQGKFRKNNLAFAYAMNDAGAVAGLAGLVDAHGQEHDVDNVAFTSVNDQGMFAGTTMGPLAQPGKAPIPARQAVIWHTGQLRSLGTLAGCRYSSGAAINQSGEVVGICAQVAALPGGNVHSSAKEQTSYPCLWNNGHWQRMGAKAFHWIYGDQDGQGTWGYRMMINGPGQAVVDHESGIKDQSFLWTAGHAISIGLVEPWAINDNGQVVGDKTDRGLSGTRAVLWQNNRLYDLNKLITPQAGLMLEEANGINNAGDIVCTGEYHDDKHIFLLTPQPPGISSPTTAIGTGRKSTR